jgi:UDP-N-acetylmuramoylalanine--D-glutamate ligase
VNAPEGFPQGVTALAGRQVLVLGLGRSGRAAAGLLLRQGARVRVQDDADTPPLREAAAALREAGATVQLGPGGLGAARPDLVVVSPGLPPAHPVLAECRQLGVPVLGEFELGAQQARCLSVAITGTNGKSTTSRMVAQMMSAHRLQTVTAGNIGTPVCDVAEASRDLDFLTLEASAFQLETIEFFRPVVAVLLNLTPDHLDRYGSMAAYARAKARIFENQQVFDWAIIQSEALALLRAHGVSIPSKVITFSARNRRADLYLDRSLIISRRDDWTGPLLNLDQCRLSGPHQAENMMAALAVGRVLRIPLELMAATLQEFAPAPHRCELVAEVGGVRYVNDSKATNLGAVQKALDAMPAAAPGEPNVWLIAGGRDKAREYYELGPLLSQRVKGAFLVGETREQLRAAWSLFTPCTLVDTLVEAVSEAARQAVPGDVVLLSPACSSFDQFHDYQHRGEVFRQAVLGLRGAEGAADQPKAPPRH